MRVYIIGFLTALLLFSAFFSGCRPKLSEAEAVFVGRETCVECHKVEYDLWTGSDHDYSMDTAIASTVLGDFNNAEFERDGFVHRFYTKDDKYFVHTKGPGGIAGEFQVAYTFGFRPLQQYLIPFEDGRLQCLQISWDTEKKRWYHLADSVYKDQVIPPDDWLYWTNNAQNWNGMCAECHSTNLQKNYNPETHVFKTTWSEIDVSCEACHGPASKHNEWASYSEYNRPKVENYALAVQTSEISSRELIDQCAYCHSRRSSYEDFIHPRERIYDIMSPQLPAQPMYYADGQILEEDYVYASFLQSKMHMNNVRCTNCHDVHSLKLKLPGNDLCLQCHKKADYDVYKHHFHKNFYEEGEALILNSSRDTVAVGEGASCINCHMPGTYFMGVDYRRDHSMRIPRPDLSDKMGTPNACNQCHTDKDAAWAASFTEKWYQKEKPFHFGETMYLAYQNDSSAVDGLLEIINSATTAPLVKATATQYISRFPDKNTHAAIREMLSDHEAVVRREAIKVFVPESIADLVTTLSPFLIDTVKMVRIEAVIRLTEVPNENLNQQQKNDLDMAVDEYIAVLNYSADFAASCFNLGNLYRNLGQLNKAEDAYKESLRIDEKFFPAIMNLAMLYNSIGQNEKAERLLKYMVKEYPDHGEAFYSLALLLSEMGEYDESFEYLKIAAEKLPNRSRVFYNLYQMHLYKQQPKEAERMLSKILEMEPENNDFLMAAIEYHIKKNDLSIARVYAKRILKAYPEHPNRGELEAFVNER